MRAPFRPAWPIRSTALAIVASRSRKTGAAWAIATRNGLARIVRLPSRRLRRADADDQLAGSLEAVRPLVLPQRLADLGPGRLALGLAETGQHLVQRAERLALEAQALGGRGHPQRRLDRPDLDVAEAGPPVGLLEHARRAQAERPVLPRRRRRQRGP